MVVYVEYVLIDNFIIDFILFYCLAKILKLKISILRFSLALLLGSGFAFLTPILHLNTVLTFIFKLLCGIVLVATAFKIKKIGKFFACYVLFIFLTFLLGGICFGLQSFLQSPTTLNGAFTYSSHFPIAIIFLAVFLFVVLGKNLFFFLKSHKKYASLEIVFQEMKYSCNALVDSGNQLIDDETKLAITFLSKRVLSKALAIDLAKNPTYKKFVCNTVVGSKVVDTIVVDRMIIDKKITILNARIAFFEFQQGQDYDAIVSSNLIV